MAVTNIYDTGGIARLDRPPGFSTITAIGVAATEPVQVGTLGANAGVLVVPGTTAAKVFHTGNVGANVATMGTDATPVTTETYIAEVEILHNTTLTGVSLLNGSAVAGNVIVALANSAGTVVATGTSTAQSGTAAFQQFAFSTAYAAVGPAKYFVLVQFNNVAARYRAHVVGNFGASKKTGETFGTFTAITPPTTFTTNLGAVADVY